MDMGVESREKWPAEAGGAAPAPGGGGGRKHLSSIANHVLRQCSLTLGRSVNDLVADFELGLKTAAVDNYSRKLVEFCSLQALQIITSHDIGEKISEGSLNRFTFDMMLAWETPTPSDQQTTMESIAKEREDRKEPLGANEAVMGDETSLFYSDIMPLLVNEDPTVGEEAYVWFGSVFPLACDVVNARFTFEALTATTANRLHYPAYDRFLKEMDKSFKFLQNLPTPTGVEFAEDEFILHMEGTAGTQRVVRHIGTSSWPGRVTLTNKALYFEASGTISYESAVKVDLSDTGIEHQINTASTGPFGVPLFDKAIVFESLSEPLVLEFPEMTSSTRRDMWLTLIREVIFIHRFISMYNIESPIHKWEVHSRIILGVIRLHAAREMLRMSPPPPSSFLVFSLYDDLPKGDFVLEQLASNLKHTSTITRLSASYVFKGLSKSYVAPLSAEIAKDQDTDSSGHEQPLASLENKIDQVKDEAREVTAANAAIEGMQEEGITDSLLVLVGLVSPIGKLRPLIQQIISWERPFVTGSALAVTLLTIYNEWFNYMLAASLILAVGMMVWARQRKIGRICSEVIIDTSSDKTTMESIVEAQQSLRKVHEYIKTANVVILRLWSIALARSPKEKLPVEQFVDRNVPETEPLKPADLEDTPFTLVEDHKGLMELAKKLKNVTEFAVDLEHNQYRSFQGLTCLMQISTRTEDFIVDTLKLRIYIGLYLQAPFKDPTKRKVMHGADRDIMWLQRDFHIYICNLFDTGQASRVLQMERNSLEYLLLHFCGVTAKKEYQNADWRSRPLPDEMIKYAREDTHYLLYIYDLMKQRLQRESTPENDLLLEVHKRSNEICLQFYEKELLTDTSYLHIYGLQEHELNSKQLAVVAALHGWRDGIARQEDESTGYVLPNKALIEIAKQMPTDTAHLKRIVRSKYPFVERNLDDIAYTIWNALEYSYAFEGIAEQLKKERSEQLALKSVQVGDEKTLDAECDKSNIDTADQSSVAPSSTANVSVASGSGAFMIETAMIDSIHLEDNTRTTSSAKNFKTLSGLTRPINKDVLSNDRYQQATQELKRPTLGALGNSVPGGQTENFGGFSKEQFQGGSNVENFRSSVLSFQQFSDGVKHSAAIGPVESFYPNTGMHSDNNVWMQSTQMNEAMQLGSATYYPQLPGYSSEAVGNRYEPEGMQMSSYLSGFEPTLQSISQSTGTGLLPGRNKEGNFQNPMRRQSYPPSSSRYDRPYQ